MAPSSAYTPPATHAPMNHAGWGRAAATSPTDRRIPEPMVLPTMMARPKATPRTFRRREEFGVGMRAELTIYAQEMTSLLPFLVAFSLQQSPDSIIARAARAITPLTDSTSLHNAGFTPLSFGPVRDLTPVGVAYSQRIRG